MRTAIAGLSILVVSIFCRADTYVRQNSIDVVHYDISMEFSDASDSISGTTRVRVRIKDGSASGMWLDFAGMRVDKLLVQGVDSPFRYGNGRLSFNFDRPYSQNEETAVEVHYHGVPLNGGMLIGRNLHGRRVFFTDNWPDRAHYWFPSIDHPSDKATVDFAVTAPDKYDIVCNGRLVRTVSLLNGRKLTEWSEARPIPTYCMSIGAAEFAIAHVVGPSSLPVDFYAYPQDAEAAAAKFRRTGIALQYFSSLIAPYPYEKLAQIQSLTRMDGVENSSAVFYRESLFRMPVSEYPVIHEIAHQWFGDSVTEGDWDHLWLSEGFATYFEALFHAAMNGPDFLKQIMARYEAKIKEFKPAGSIAVIDPSLADPMKKLNPVSYEKGAWILHMLRGMVGDERFFEGIRRYYGLYKDGNALSDDFRRAMESASGTDLGTFFTQWLYQPGWPHYHVSWHWKANTGEAEITIKQDQNTGCFDMPLEIVLKDDDGSASHKIHLAEAVQSFILPARGKPSAVEIDPEGWVLKSVSVVDRQPESGAGAGR
jgi:aminopeptidase N